MSMRSQRGRITSDLLTQFEATQDAYNDQIARLNLYSLTNETYSDVIFKKMIELSDEEKTLGGFSQGELYAMQKVIKDKVESFLRELDEQGITT